MTYVIFAIKTFLLFFAVATDLSQLSVLDPENFGLVGLLIALSPGLL